MAASAVGSACHVEVCGLALGPRQPQEAVQQGPTRDLKVPGSSSRKNVMLEVTPINGNWVI